jgi:hypothetical protein
MTDEHNLRGLLDEVLSEEEDRPKFVLKAAAIIEEALRQEGLDAVLVGGGAVEIYAPGAYTTTDLDFVVPHRFGVPFEQAIRRAFTALGFRRADRHWVRSDLFVEIPSSELHDPVEELQVGPFALRVLRKESVLAYRIVGFKQWRYTDYGAQAIALIRAFGDDIDEQLLFDHLRREASEDAYHFLHDLAFSERAVSDSVLRKWLNDFAS